MIRLSEFERQWAELRDRPLFVACSGGLDSGVLVDLLRRFCPHITLLHVNYHLRGIDSDEDALFVKQLAEKHHLRYDVLNIDLKKQLQTGQNLQQEARRIRYAWFGEQLKQQSGSILLTAHHADDQVETFYLQLARGAGIRGMAGMELRGKQLYRPLLPYTRSQLEAYALEHGLNWRHDRSNDSNDYARNRLRNEFLPFLETHIPDIRQQVLTLMAAFQHQRSKAMTESETLLKRIRKQEIIAIEEVAFTDELVWIIVLNELDFLAAQLPAFQKLVQAPTGKCIQSPRWQITRERNGLAFTPRHQQMVLPQLQLQQVSQLPATYSKEVIYLDADLIRGALVIRRWQEGDRMAPLGMKGTQLISDILKDAGVAHHQRAAQWVVCDDSTIHWCVGQKIGRKAVATPSSRKIIRLSITTEND